MSEQPAGWYRDPVALSAYRWWDGAQWTALTQEDQQPPVSTDTLAIPFDAPDRYTERIVAADPWWSPSASTADPSATTSLPDSPSGRLRRRSLGTPGPVLAVAVVLAVLLGGIGFVIADTAGSSGPSLSSLATNPTTPAGELQSASIAAATKQNWVHLQVVTDDAGQTVVSSNTVGPSSGRQVLTDGDATATILVTPGMAYLDGNADGLSKLFGFTAGAASQYANQWISFTPQDAPYAGVAQDVTLASALADSTLTGTLSRGPSGSEDGTTVEPVSGLLPASAGVGNGVSATVLISAATLLPVQLRYSSAGVTSTETFSAWGQAITVTPPAHSVAYATLPGSSASSGDGGGTGT